MFVVNDVMSSYNMAVTTLKALSFRQLVEIITKIYNVKVCLDLRNSLDRSIHSINTIFSIWCPYSVKTFTHFVYLCVVGCDKTVLWNNLKMFVLAIAYVTIHLKAQSRSVNYQFFHLMLVRTDRQFFHIYRVR